MGQTTKKPNNGSKTKKNKKSPHLRNRNDRVGDPNDGLHHGTDQAFPHALEEPAHAALLRPAHGGGEYTGHTRREPPRDVLAALTKQAQQASARAVGERTEGTNTW